jgi:predicted DNA-binding transcriptional regulator YafY
VLKGGIWYLVAGIDDQLRTYRVARIQKAALDEASFARPPGFDLATYWTESIAAYEREAPTVEVSVRVEPHHLGRLADQVGSAAMASATRLEEADADGWTRLRLNLAWPDEVPGRLLGMGGWLEVIDPPQVRERVVKLAAAVVQRHGWGG